MRTRDLQMSKIGQLIPHWKNEWLKNWIFQPIAKCSNRHTRNYFRQSLTALCMWTSTKAHACFLNVNWSKIGRLIPNWKRDWLIQVTQWMQLLSALRSGITVASEVHPRRGYCWLKTFPNIPQNGLRYSRLCNFWRPMRGPNYKLKQWKDLKEYCSDFFQISSQFNAEIKRSRSLLLQAIIVKKILIIALIKCSQLKLNTKSFH